VEIGLVGCNHRTAPVEFRERLTFRRGELPEQLAHLVAAASGTEAVILSTCNRTEAVVAGEKLAGFPETVIGFLAEAKGVEVEELRKRTYVFTGEEAARHLFAVAASLDSLVPGEPEILAQTRKAFAAARSCGTAGVTLTALFERAFRAAKAIRTETAVARGRVSVGSAAVDLAGKIFQDFGEKRIVLFGTGEMGVRILERLASTGAKSITVVSRSAERARSVASRFGAGSAGYDRRDELLQEADIVITAAEAPHAILRREELGELLERRASPLCIIDVAVPRNVEPELAAIPEVYLYNIDDIEGVIHRALARRTEALAEAEPIVERELEGLRGDWAAVTAKDVVLALRKKYHGIREEELAEHASWLAGLEPAERERVERLARHLVDRLLHEPCVEIEREVRDGAEEVALLLARRIFRLDSPPPAPAEGDRPAPM